MGMLITKKKRDGQLAAHNLLLVFFFFSPVSYVCFLATTDLSLSLSSIRLIPMFAGPHSTHPPFSKYPHNSYSSILKVFYLKYACASGLDCVLVSRCSLELVSLAYTSPPPRVLDLPLRLHQVENNPLGLFLFLFDVEIWTDTIFYPRFSFTH